ncbi:tRNA (adenosine(37)-N6)-threonylcarbamoyltransferase complex transferase subunit TsaD [Candidatus Daviesbacteria bacterium]|nr:tRNA (adenosine(37)-N6)-threonylcarbamoyltransferase complex transferase subunit TsaD [Candidatus Daviesbacteria bacterium]
MIILGIETSCDETAAAVLQKQGDRITILSNVVASSATLQAKYGGIIPEQAAREQIKSIIPVIETAINDSRFKINDINAIAVTFGPGLIGSLLVGVETAKTLSLIWEKPLIPVNHLIGHFYANWIGKEVPKFPCLGLLVSGGHTDLVLFENHGKYKYLGGTRDDAAGECFDKCARLLGLPYPGGPEISKLAKQGNPTKFNLPVPMKGSKDLDFSYSGLKTAVANLVRSEKDKADLAAAIEETIVKSLIDKIILATKIYPVEQIMIAGGVAANQKLVRNLQFTIYNLQLKTKLHVPPPELCTDNAAMIAAAAFFNYHPVNPLILQANPGLSLT